MNISCISSRRKSKSIYDESCNFIPFGVNSPVRAFKNISTHPLIVRSGYQDEIVDVDGNRYIDYCQSWGSLIHGHAHPILIEVAQKRIAMGSSFGIATEEELLIAKKIAEHVPEVDLIRFVSSGTEATMSSVRLARAFTKREYIIKFTGNYHGHADGFLVNAGSGLARITSTSSSEGLVKEAIKYTLSLPYNCIDSVKRAFRDPVIGKNIAAIIVEPIAANMGVVAGERAFLQSLREECTKGGALLIFDEVITGFRLRLGSFASFYQCAPDLICFGKIVGGGYPAAAFGGRKEVMELLAPSGPVYQAGTLSGNPVAMAAGLAALELCEREGFYEELEEKTRIITDPVAAFIAERGIHGCIQQVGSLFTLFFGVKSVLNFEDTKNLDLEVFNRFFLFMLERGVYFSPSQFEANFVSMAHQNIALYKTRDLILEFLERQI